MDKIRYVLKNVMGGGKILLITNIITLLVLGYVAKTSGYVYDIKVKFGIVDKPKDPDYWAIKGWENTMLKLNYKADIVFFGNSITYNGNFNRTFSDKKIVNLGYPGDRIDGMIRRVETIKAVNPDKVFLMAGINGLRDMDLNDFTIKYNLLVDSIKKAVPNAEIYLQSILPVNSSRSTNYGSNNKIAVANYEIKNISNKKGCKYVDLVSIYIHNNEMPIELTVDGIHLKDTAYQRWYDNIRKLVN